MAVVDMAEQMKILDGALERALGARSIRPGQAEANPSVVIGPNTAFNVNSLFSSYAPLAYMLPFEMLDFIELLAVYNADYSQAVENMRTLANPGHTVMIDATAGVQKDLARRIQAKDKQIQHKHGGIEGLIDKLLWQAAVYGAMAGEWVPDEDMSDIVDFIDVNPKTIRFFWEFDPDEDPFQVGPHWAPYQRATMKQIEEAEKNGQKVKNGAYVKLNELTFQYFSFNAAPGSPYGVPPFLAALNNIAMQRDMQTNMAALVRKMALLGLIDIEVQALQPTVGETQAQYQARATAYLENFANLAVQMLDSGGVIHFDDAKITSTNLSGNAAGATNIFTQNEEQVFSGLKSMPSVQGRCLDPRSRILMADGTLKKLSRIRVGDLIQGFDEQTSSTRRRWRVAKVENIWEVEKPSVRFRFSDGRSIVCSEDHPFLMQLQSTGCKEHFSYATRNRLSQVSRDAANARWNGYQDELKGTEWRRARDIYTGDWLKALDEPLPIVYESQDYKAGYVAGACAGDGCLSVRPFSRRDYWQLAVQISDEEIIERCYQYICDLGIPDEKFSHYIREPNLFPVGTSFAGTQKMIVLKTCKHENVKFLARLCYERDSNEYKAGWLAGLYDTDGSRHVRERGREQLRLCQNDGAIKDRAEVFLSDLGFSTTRHDKWIEIIGDRLEKWRFTATVRPVLHRKMVVLEERTVRTFKPVQVIKVEKVGVRQLIDLTTSTSTLVANGCLSHNSYSTTETYAGVAYDIMIRQSLRYQRAAKLMIEYGYNLMALMWGLKVNDINVQFKENKSLQRLQISQAHHWEILNALMKWAAGITGQVDAAHELGYADVDTKLDEVPNSPWFAAGLNTPIAKPYEEAPNPDAGKEDNEGNSQNEQGKGDNESEEPRSEETDQEGT